MINIFEVKNWYKFQLNLSDLCQYLFQVGIIEISMKQIENSFLIKVKSHSYFDNIKKIDELKKHLEIWHGYSLDVKYK